MPQIEIVDAEVTHWLVPAIAAAARADARALAVADLRWRPRRPQEVPHLTTVVAKALRLSLDMRVGAAAEESVIGDLSAKVYPRWAASVGRAAVDATPEMLRAILRAASGEDAERGPTLREQPLVPTVAALGVIFDRPLRELPQLLARTAGGSREVWGRSPGLQADLTEQEGTTGVV